MALTEQPEKRAWLWGQFEREAAQRDIGGMIQHDCSAHFDRMYPANANVTATKKAVAREICLCTAKTIEKMERRILELAYELQERLLFKEVWNKKYHQQTRQWAMQNQHQTRMR